MAAGSEAAAKANIAADIEKLPGGDFVLAEGGANLSMPAAAGRFGPDLLAKAPDPF